MLGTSSVAPSGRRSTDIEIRVAQAVNDPHRYATRGPIVRGRPADARGPDRPGKEAAAIELWRERDGHWRWAYREGGREILSNNPYASEAEARAAASTAYPGTPISPVLERPNATSGRPPNALTFLLSVTALWRWYRDARRSRPRGP